MLPPFPRPRSGLGLNELLDHTPHFLPFFCDKALAAADFESFDVRPSRRVFEAADAAALEVDFPGALLWARALPAADFEAFAVEGLESVLEALLAAVLDVTSFLAISISRLAKCLVK